MGTFSTVITLSSLLVLSGAFGYILSNNKYGERIAAKNKNARKRNMESNSDYYEKQASLSRERGELLDALKDNEKAMNDLENGNILKAMKEKYNTLKKYIKRIAIGCSLILATSIPLIIKTNALIAFNKYVGGVAGGVAILGTALGICGLAEVTDDVIACKKYKKSIDDYERILEGKKQEESKKQIKENVKQENKVKSKQKTESNDIIKSLNDEYLKNMMSIKIRKLKYLNEKYVLCTDLKEKQELEIQIAQTQKEYEELFNDLNPSNERDCEMRLIMK